MNTFNKNTFKLLFISSLSVLLLVSCSCNVSNPETTITTPVNSEFKVLECPDEAYIDSFITVKAIVPNYSKTIDYRLSLEQDVEGEIYINRVLYSGNCEADNENIVLWYFQISSKAYAGIANISIVADEGIGEVFNRNIIIRE
jgi:hypothetical protein